MGFFSGMKVPVPRSPSKHQTGQRRCSLGKVRAGNGAGFCKGPAAGLQRAGKCGCGSAPGSPAAAPAAQSPTGGSGQAALNPFAAALRERRAQPH